MRYQSTRPKRQFLAGVVCRQCGNLDTTVQVQTFDPVDEYIECITCGYQERRPKAVDNNQAEDTVGVVRFKP